MYAVSGGVPFGPSPYFTKERRTKMSEAMWVVETFVKEGDGHKSVGTALSFGDPEWAVESSAEVHDLGEIVHHTLNGTVFYERGHVTLNRYQK
ncbi:Hypothetical Protein OBI_RACECAR_62 [Arthrobacter phage Racecar]|nr:hypothetical protein PBI_RACECAR_144 [Arthrobacter phage Racecar]